ncbi:glycoside hydrolase family 3 N-terminal domain-containing protein [Bradyrhizobium sp. STM 3557]|uniref:glycoside hydrolase family 3 N-terminal domain-containing protein n=1 Tax=Bradyrhizobium sp. STM 3557 TaxID=578920 RepID=UPI003890933D
MLRRIGIVALWLPALFLILIAVNSNEPYLVRLRGAGHIALVMMAIGVPTAMIYRGAWRGGIARRLLLAAWCVPFVAFVAAQSVFAFRKYQALHIEATTARLLGPHFVVGYDNPEEAAMLAGVYVTRHNAAGRTAVELKSEIARLQAARTAAHLPPLIVAADQEGGIVAHLSPPLPDEPALSSLATVAPDQREAQAEAYGRRQGADLASIGVTLNLAPVLDLRPDWQRNRLDFNTLISQRAIASDPAIVSDIAGAYARGLEAAGVNAAVKHFPGLGRVRADTHHFAAKLDTPLATLEAADWRPFREVLATSRAALMVGHVAVTTLDPDRPASHAKAVLDGLIRKRWNYRGVIITDDLVMGAIYGGDVCQTVVEALNGGADLLLVAYDGAQFYRVFDCAAQALARGELDMAMLRASDTRLQRWSGE